MSTPANRALSVAVAVAIASIAPVTAQEGAGGDAEKLGTIIVTGTRSNHRTESEAITPIDVVPASVLQQTGTTELSTALARVIPSLTFPRPSAADTADSQRPAQLRGLSPDQVLVLVDGKRWHPGAIILTNGVLGRGSQAVDLNTIPIGAIDRIEVLRDGASAQYGSDAIAGVINIVLKKGAKGGTVEAGGGQYSAGDGRQWRASANFGLPLGDTPDSFLRVTVQDGHQDFTNRAGPNKNYAWLGKRQRFGDPDVWDKNVLLNAQYALADNIQVYAFGHWGQRNSISPAFYRAPGSNPLVADLYPLGYLPLETANSIDQSLAAGLRGTTAGGWRWDVSANYGGNRVGYGTKDSINLAWLNDFGRTQTRFHDGHLSAELQSFDVDIAKDVSVGFLPNPVTVAFGGQYLRQTYGIRAGEEASWYTGTSGVSGGAQGFGGYQPANAGSHARHDVAGYVSLETSLTDRLSGSLAVRHEDYSDFGDTTSGSLAGRFDFNDRFALRASASTGFRAPSLAQQFYAYTSSLYYGEGNSLGLPPGIYSTGLVPATSAVGQLLGAQALKPEKSRNLTVGAVWNPTDAWSLSVDLYQIHIDDRITLSSNLATNTPAVQQYLAAHGVTDANYAGIAYFTNAVDTRTRGIDVVGTYRWEFAGGGKLDATLSWNRNLNKVTHVKPNPPVLDELGLNLRRIDRRDQFGLLADTTPKSKLILNGLYRFDRWGFSATLTRYDRFVAVNSTNPALDQTFGAKWLLDLAVDYTLDRWTFTLGGDNVLDTYPDRTIAATSNNGALPYSVFSPFGFNGAYAYGKVAYRW